jgi:hypothetical protein
VLAPHAALIGTESVAAFTEVVEKCDYGSANDIRASDSKRFAIGLGGE